MAAPRVLTKCLAAKQQRNAVDASHGTVRHIRGSARTEADHDGQEGRQGAGGTPRLPGLTGVAGTRSWRDVSCGTGSGPCRVRKDGQRAARRVPNGWRARCRKTRRGCRMRRQGNTRQSGNTAPRCGVRLPWRVPGSPSKTKHHRPRPPYRGRGARLLPPEANRAESTAAHVRHGSIWRIANNVRVDPRGRRPWRRNPNSRAPSGEDDAPTALRPAPAPEAGRRPLARHAPGLPHQSARPCVRPRRGPRAGRRSRDTRFRRDRSRSRNRRRTPRATD